MKRLTLTYQNRRVISDAFNFKAYRLMHDALSGAEVTAASLDAAALTGVAALFDGTEITEDVLCAPGRLDDGEVVTAMKKVIDWYLAVKPGGSTGPVVGTPPERPIIALYKSFLDRHLPSDIDKQDPQLMFDVMFADEGDVMRVEDIPPELRHFYGM